MMLRRIVLAAALLLGLGIAGPMASLAQACPMCKVANEQDSLLPKAYMYSILFMMGMMFTIGGGMGLGMYLLSRKENAAIEGWEQGVADAESGVDGLLPGGLQPATT
jgi:hypothetical protein